MTKAEWLATAEAMMVDIRHAETKGPEVAAQHLAAHLQSLMSRLMAGEAKAARIGQDESAQPVPRGELTVGALIELIERAQLVDSALVIVQVGAHGADIDDMPGASVGDWEQEVALYIETR
jgi:hypothetical protein